MKADLTTVCRKEAQGEVRAFLNTFLEEMDISDSLRNQIVLAIDEAMANAIIHGNDADSSKSVKLVLDVNDKRLQAEISDIGLFDEITKSDKKDKELKTIIKEKQKGGLGLKLIYSIMDMVVFYTKGNQSYCRLVKLLTPEE